MNHEFLKSELHISLFYYLFKVVLMNSRAFVKTENIGRKKKGKREYLSNPLTRNLMKQIDNFFEFTIKVPQN